MPGALIQALMNDSGTRVLQRPQLRASDGGKASLKIGSKIPYVQGSLQSAVATPGSLPYATTSFQPVDVGVLVDLQPHVNGPDDVSMHIKVEVSTVTGNETIAGVQQPIIGQRINEADIRMKDGEATILGGLVSDSDAKTTSGIPGLVNVPGLAYLFGTKTKDREQDEILIGLVPHIIRAPDFAAMGERAVASGALDSIHVIRGGVVDTVTVTIPPPAVAPAAKPAAPVPAGTPPPAGSVPPNVFGPPVTPATAPPSPSTGGPPVVPPATPPAPTPTAPPADATTPPKKQ